MAESDQRKKLTDDLEGDADNQDFTMHGQQNNGCNKTNKKYVVCISNDFV